MPRRAQAPDFAQFGSFGCIQDAIAAEFTSMSYRQVVCATLIALACAQARADGEHWVQYFGTARSGQPAQFAYRERHSLHFQGDRLVERVVLYQCADGSAFARKTVSYVDATAPDFLFEDASNGMREGVRGGPAGRMMLFRPNGGEPERSAALPQVPGLVIDAGFDEYIRTRWRDLLQSGPQSMPFLVPSRQRHMNFRVEHLRRQQIEADTAEVFRLKLDGVFGWLLPGIDVAYDANEHWLLRYDGLSDLRDVAGNNFLVHVVFRPGERTAGDAATDQTLRDARLAACR